MKKIIMLTLSVILGTSGLATAAILDFEDLYPGYETAYYPIANSYHGFTMGDEDGFITKNYSYLTFGVYDGYYYGTAGKVSMFSAYSHTVSLAQAYDFNVYQLDLTAANHPTQDVEIQGWKGGSLMYSTDVTAVNTGRTIVNLWYLGIDTLKIIPVKDGGANQVVIDNLTYTAPLPSTLLFLGTGLLGLVGFRGKKS
jgi:hypothetical protein